MIPESIWPGMFQAEAGRANTARARSRRDANTATTTSYAIAGFARGSRTLRATNEMRCVGPLWHCGVEPGSASPNARERANIALVI
jgi:hypothetical protein